MIIHCYFNEYAYVNMKNTKSTKKNQRKTFVLSLAISLPTDTCGLRIPSDEYVRTPKRVSARWFVWTSNEPRGAYGTTHPSAEDAALKEAVIADVPTLMGLDPRTSQMNSQLLTTGLLEPDNFQLI